jgi:pimeloyl-ACP methyl ester carboxylesterase
MIPKRLRVEFPGSQGVKLVGRLEVPADDPVAFAIFAHCFTCTKDMKAAAWISHELSNRRIAVLRFDFAGLGESGGAFGDTNFTSNLEDLVAAAEFLRRSYQAPQILIGHSLGGTAVLVAAARIPEAAAVCTLAAPSETGHLQEFLRQQAPDLRNDEAVNIDVMGHEVPIKEQLVADLRKYDIPAAIAGLGRPLLIFHSPDDQVVNIEHARRIFEAAKHPKSFIALDGADHLLIERETDARFVAEMLATWSRRYVRRNGPSQPRTT